MIAEQYETGKIMSATPMELVVLMYDNALRHLAGAIDAFEEEDDLERLQKVNNHLLRAQDFIAELACSVDVERGGEMAQDLNRLYEFMMRHLATANTTCTRTPVVEVQTIMRELRDGWAQALATIPREERPEPVAVERTSSFRFSG